MVKYPLWRPGSLGVLLLFQVSSSKMHWCLDIGIWYLSNEASLRWGFGSRTLQKRYLTISYFQCGVPED